MRVSVCMCSSCNWCLEKYKLKIGPINVRNYLLNWVFTSTSKLIIIVYICAALRSVQWQSASIVIWAHGTQTHIYARSLTQTPINIMKNWLICQRNNACFVGYYYHYWFEIDLFSTYSRSASFFYCIAVLFWSLNSFGVPLSWCDFSETNKAKCRVNCVECGRWSVVNIIFVSHWDEK